jgi:hypothetical protein
LWKLYRLKPGWDSWDEKRRDSWEEPWRMRNKCLGVEAAVEVNGRKG